MKTWNLVLNKLKYKKVIANSAIKMKNQTNYRMIK